MVKLGLNEGLVCSGSRLELGIYDLFVLRNFPFAGVSKWKGKPSDKGTKPRAMDTCLGQSDCDFPFDSSNKSQGPGSKSDSELVKFGAEPIPSDRISDDEIQHIKPDYSLKRKGSNLGMTPAKMRTPPWNMTDSGPDDMLNKIDSFLECDGNDISRVAYGSHSATGTVSCNAS